MRNITRSYIRQIINTNFENFSPKTIQAAQEALLDTVGCMIAGVQSPIGKSAIDVFAGLGGVEEATIIGDGRKLPAPISAYINGQCSVGPDLADNYLMDESVVISHPGEAVIPAILALSEKIGASMRQVLISTILGYETAGRYALSIEPRRPEVYSFSTHYPLAAAVACAKLLGFNEDRMINTLGIAGTLAPLPATKPMWGFRKEQRPASWHRDMPGHANFAAVVACLFGNTNFKATHQLLEEDTYYFKIAGSDNYYPERLFENWGKKFIIDEVTYKYIPSCYFSQTCVEALRLLIEEKKLKIHEIKKIELHAPSHFVKNFVYYPPISSVDTASSLKYLAAMWLMSRKPGTDWYLHFEQYLKMSEYQNIAEKIEVISDEELQIRFDREGKLFGKAVIISETGTHSKTISVIKGNPQNPFTMNDIEKKFRMLTVPIIGDEKTEKFINNITGSDFNLNIRDIINAL
jgi:2-methylcitrate dehydratase PrpD